ncbi:MAG: hypothetical protein ABSG92_11260 [Conexivisphaerales archaeon]
MAIWTTTSIGSIQVDLSGLQPTWSADGTDIAFSCNLCGTYHIRVMPAAAGPVAQESAGY